MKLFFLLISVLFSMNAVSAMSSKFVIGTAVQGGGYAKIGEYLCLQLNEDNLNSCEIIYTAGSADNINLLNKNKINVFLTQEDVLYNAYNGLSEFFSKGKQSTLRKIIPLYPETLNILVPKNSKIKNISDLKSKYIRVVGARSGSFFTARLYMELSQWRTDDYKSITYSMNYNDSLNDLCANSLDALVVVSGNVNPILQQYIKKCNLRFMSVDGMSFVLTKRYPYYFKATIPASLYDKSLKDVNSFGVYSFLSTTTNLSDSDVNTLIEAYIKIIPKILKDNPLFNINNTSFIKDDFKNDNSDSVPYHRAATNYFKSKGFIK